MPNESPTSYPVDQINRGSQQQSSGAQSSVAAIAQIERGATVSQQRSKQALERGETLIEII